MNGTDTPTTNKRTASPYNQNTTTGPFAERGGPHTSGRAGASPSGGVADGSVHRSFLFPGTVRGLQAAEYDPDWPSPEELRAMAPRYPEHARRRDICLFCLCAAALVLLALLHGGCEPFDADRAPVGAATATTATTATTTTTTGAAATAALALDFRFGGVSAKPVEDPRCRLSGLRIGKDSLSFKWASEIPSDWRRGATGKGMMILACAFYEENSRWVGGKFDWIDEARASRPLENIHTGYGGWNAAAWAAAKRRAFCVMSADGKKRSNLLEEAK